MEPVKDGGTFQVVDLLRTAALVPVLASHSLASLAPGASGPAALWGFFGRNNLYGVTAFFVVSGFLITRVLAGGPGGLERPSLRRFYVRRAGRILPLALLFILIGCLFLAWGRSQGAQVPDRFLHPWIYLSLLSFTFNWYQIAVNVPWFGLHWMVFWSLAVEEQFYALYPLALRKWGKARSRVALLVGVALWGPAFRLGAAWMYPDHFWLRSIATFSALDALALGALLHLAWEAHGAELRRRPALALGLSALGAVLVVHTYATTSIHDPWDLVWGPTLLALGCFFFLLGGLAVPAFESDWLRPLALPGRYSYGNYLLHTTVLFFTASYLSALPPLVSFPAYFAVCTVVAGLSFRYFESPLNRWIRRAGGAGEPTP